MEKITKIKLAGFALFVCILFGCANQQPPMGGPVDQIPPEIVEVYPENGTTNFSDDYIELTFSEYVDRRSVQEAIFISPAVEGEVEYDWSEKSLEIHFEKLLAENTTYTITVGTDVIDLNNRNNMAESFTLTFSTGNEIDRCSIAGKVYDSNPLGTMIFAYILSDTIPNPLTQKPNYLSQVGSNGLYNLVGLKPADFRVIAVKDEFRNLIYNIGEDMYGVPYRDIKLTKEDSAFVGLNFFLSGKDTTLPQILSVVMTDRNHILLEFTKPIDSTRVTRNNFSIFDSTTFTHIPTKYFFKGRAKRNEFYVALGDTINVESNNFLIAKDIIDKYGNLLSNEAVSFSAAVKPDTSKPTIYEVKTLFENKTIDFVKPQIEFLFDDGIDQSQIIESILILDGDQNSIPFNFLSNDDSHISIFIVKSLKPNSEIQAKIVMDRFKDAAGNYQDTTLSFTIKTIGDFEFTGASGRLKNVTPNKNIVMKLTGIDGKSNYTQLPNTDNKFEFRRVIPGKYLLWAFSDLNNDTSYSYGSLGPFNYSEKFLFHPDTLNLRARWPVGDIEFIYK